MSDLTLEYLKSQLRYEPDTGNFIRLVVLPKANRIAVGDIAGNLSKTSGYRTIGVATRKYRANRLAWFYMTGKWPVGDVDHNDRVCSNDKWDNLRLATRQQTCANRTCLKETKSGVKGVFPIRSKFRAHIKIDGKSRNLGTFDSLSDAAKAYLAAAQEAFGEYSTVGR